MENLYIGYNREENFRILICAWEKEDAEKLAKEYGEEGNFEGNFDEITPLNSLSDEEIKKINFDCDYVIC